MLTDPTQPSLKQTDIKDMWLAGNLLLILFAEQ